MKHRPSAASHLATRSLITPLLVVAFIGSSSPAGAIALYALKIVNTGEALTVAGYGVLMLVSGILGAFAMDTATWRTPSLEKR
jgi:hypothetical protein